MAANELSPPGVSIHGPTDEENDSDENRENANEDRDQSVNRHDEDELSDHPGAVESERIVSELAENLDDAEIDKNENNSFSSADVVGDRVLVEKDGKFELVDIAEVKAEYFAMKGIDKRFANQIDDEKPAEDQKVKLEQKKDKKANQEGKKARSPRPKTSPMRGNSSKMGKDGRIASATVARKHNEEYSYIKSKYGMTEHQLEMKKKREEAIARRKKEEEERIAQDLERRREEAEQAFQAWLKAKNEEYMEKRKSQRPSDDQEKVEKDKAAKEAYEAWLNEKSKQRKQERETEKKKLEEEASSYVIRERQECDEAFRRWLREKQFEERKKLAAQKAKKQKRKRKPHKVEAPPMNSSSIRFTDYYGYSHTVAL